MTSLADAAECIAALPRIRRTGRVTAVLGTLIEIGGLDRDVAIGTRIEIETRNSARVGAEIVGFRDGRVTAMPFASLEDVGPGCHVELRPGGAFVRPDESWLGRVVNALGEPIDGKGPLRQGALPYRIKGAPPPAHQRQRVAGKLDLGIRALNAFLTCCRGQRMGIFAGSGVGKSILMSMLARHTRSDVNVIGLIGERGREVREFISDTLGDGLARSVVVVATSDESPLMRRQAAHLTLAFAEYFRDRDRDVLCMMDSVTRFAMAQREIGLAAGEPPAMKGYTPTVFAELPKLLERAGPGTGAGTITGLFTVLVDGGDHDEPIADAVRGILDGHIVMDRAIAERGRFPAINVLKSVSRTMPGCNSTEENALVGRARALLTAYEDMEELIRLGAYKRGSDPTVDEAIRLRPALERFLAQEIDERSGFAETYAALASILDGKPPAETEDKDTADRRPEKGAADHA